jgi:hypothetical protein
MLFIPPFFFTNSTLHWKPCQPYWYGEVERYMNVVLLLGDEDISYGGTGVKNKCLGNLMFFINTRQPGETPQLLRVSVAKNIETRIIPSFMLLITLKTFIL